MVGKRKGSVVMVKQITSGMWRLISLEVYSTELGKVL